MQEISTGHRHLWHEAVDLSISPDSQAHATADGAGCPSIPSDRTLNCLLSRARQCLPGLPTAPLTSSVHFPKPAAGPALGPPEPWNPQTSRRTDHDALKQSERERERERERESPKSVLLLMYISIHACLYLHRSKSSRAPMQRAQWSGERSSDHLISADGGISKKPASRKSKLNLFKAKLLWWHWSNPLLLKLCCCLRGSAEAKELWLADFCKRSSDLFCPGCE